MYTAARRPSAAETLTAHFLGEGMCLNVRALLLKGDYLFAWQLFLEGLKGNGYECIC